MKQLLALLFALLLTAGSAAAAGVRHYVTLTFTNNANLTNGIQLTVNGDVRTGEDIVTNAPTQFARSNRVDYLRTNLFTTLSLYPFTGMSVTYGSNTNQLVLIGNTNVVITASFFGSWGSVSAQTNPVYGASPVVSPFTTESNSFRQFIMSSLVTDLTNATSSIPATATAVGNLLNTATNAQNVTNKNFFGGVHGSLTKPVYSGGIIFSNSGLGFVVGSTQFFEVTISADNKLYQFAGPTTENTNVIATFLDVTNRTFQFNTNQFHTSTATAPKTVTLQTNALIYSPVLIGSNYVSGDIWLDGDFYVGGSFWSADVDEEWNFFSNAEGKTSGTVLRFIDFTPAQFGFDADGKVSLTNGLLITNTVLRNPTLVGHTTNSGTNLNARLINANIEAATFTATNIVGANAVSGRFLWAAGTVSSLVNGNNAGIALGTNQAVELSGATTIAQIAGFAATSDGDERLIRFSGAITNWIVNEANSSFSTDATAANRIVTGTGGDITLTNQPSWARFRYRGTSSRWELIHWSR